MKNADPGRECAAPANCGAMSAALAAPGFLEGGEIILCVWKPGPLSMLLGALPQLAAITFLVSICGKIAPGLGANDPILAALALSAIILTWHLLDWLGKSFILTDRRVLRLHGVVNPGQTEQIRLRDIEQLELRRHFLQQAFGLSSLQIAPARGQPLVWEDLGNGPDIQARVADAVNRYK